MRYLFGLILILALAAGGAFMYAGRMPGPSIQITKPVKYVGQSATVEVAITAPGGKLADYSIVFEQNGKQTPLASMTAAGGEAKADGRHPRLEKRPGEDRGDRDASGALRPA